MIVFYIIYVISYTQCNVHSKNDKIVSLIVRVGIVLGITRWGVRLG